MKRRFKKANLLWTIFLDLCNAAAIAMPWRTCYVHPGYLRDHKLIRHETAHFDQMDRDGTIKFCCKYIYYNIKYGYWANPYEVEAREQTERAFGRECECENTYDPITQPGNL